MLALAAVLFISAGLFLGPPCKQPSRLDFSDQWGMAILLATPPFCSVLSLRTLSGSALSFISGMIVASPGLAWALVLTFMSQVSPVKLLGNQMAGLI